MVNNTSIIDLLKEEQVELQNKIEEMNDIIYSLVDETISKDNLPKNVLNLMLEKKRYVKMHKESNALLKELPMGPLKGGLLDPSSLIKFVQRNAKFKKIMDDIIGKYKKLVDTKKSVKKSSELTGLIYPYTIKYGLSINSTVAYINKLVDGGVLHTKYKVESKMNEAKSKSIAFAFGRFNPPTIGHEKLITKLASVRVDDMRVYISQSQDPKKNPLSPRQKLSYMKSIFPRYGNKIMIPKTNIVIDIITDLYNEGFTDLKMVAGSDRVNEFKKLFVTYNDVKSRHGYYNFDSIEVISAGERDPDAEGASGMSASKMRAAAQDNDLETFEKGLPNFRGVEKLFKDVRKGMNLAASYSGHSNYKPIASLEQFEQKQIRDMYIREMLFNKGDVVENVNIDVKGKVLRRGTNYVVIEDSNNNLHKSWIWDCIPVPPNREVEVREHDLNVDYGFTPIREEDMNEDMDAQPQDKDVKKIKGTQPKKYFKGLSKDAKMKRARHFNKKGKLHHKDPERYSGKRPGDNDDSKPSKPADATIKVRKMLKQKGFNELKNEIAPISEGSLEDVTKRLRAKKIRVKTITRTKDKVTHLYVHVNDVDDAQKILKNDPLYVAGKLRVVAKEEVQNEACWSGYKQVGMKDKGGKQVPNCVPEEMSIEDAMKVDGYIPESYEDGQDYANHAKEITPNEKPDKKPIDSKKRTPENRITADDVKEWALQGDTIDKYKGRYGDEWKSKLIEVTKKMMEKIDEKF